MTTELDRFYELADDIGIAMLTTRRSDGHLRSRAMANQKRAAGADLWFVTTEGADKLREINDDAHVNWRTFATAAWSGSRCRDLP